MVKETYCDGGYGILKNISKYDYFLQLTEENQEKYLIRLEKEDKKKFQEFIRYYNLDEK